MTKKKRFGVSQELSRGLTETINVVENNAGTYRNIVLPLSRIELDPDNPRRLNISLSDVRGGLEKSDDLYQVKSDELERLKELSTTIESSGVINPIVVYKRNEHYRVVAGERRCLASILAGKNEIDARVFTEKPKGFDLKLVQWIENTAREDLSLEERIDNINEIILEHQKQKPEVSITATFLKKITGLSLPQVTYYMTVLNAPSDVKRLIKSGSIRSLDKAAVISSVNSSIVREEALTACVNGASLKDLRKLITRAKQIETVQPEKPPVAKKRGRSLSKINMGSTLSTDVVQTIIESVISRGDYEKYAHYFKEVDWMNLDQTSKAFKKLIQILEHEFVR